MKRQMLIWCAIACLTTAYAQKNDTTINRVVTVERDFQPVIQNAGKLNINPSVIEREQTLNPVVYSTYSAPLSIGFNVHPLQAAETNFAAQSPLQGFVDGAIGHRNTHFGFGYRIAEKKKMSLDLFANHDAMWGRQTLSQTQLGMVVTRHFSAADLYFGVDGNNEYYSLYGRYYNGDSTGFYHKSNNLTINKISDMSTADWQDSWLVNTRIGIRSRGNVAVRYDLNTGYSAYILPDAATEHQIRTRLNATWAINDAHNAGLNFYAQDNLYTISDSLHLSKDAYHNRHNFWIEPFYAYTGTNFRIHAGVNFDFNLGTGAMMSSRQDISFAPSPNVSFEWFIMKEILNLYGTAKGHYGTGTLLEYMQTNRYMDITEGITTNHVDDYTPVDAQLGFKIRPISTMVLDIYTGYAYLMNQQTLVAPSVQFNTHYSQSYLHFYYSNLQCWKVGAKLHYHWRDILDIHLSGNYYHWIGMNSEMYTNLVGVYDRPSWDAHLRIDAHIDSKWSIYSDNTFVGSRRAFTIDGTDETLQPIVSLNLGASYAINRWLSTYIQLNNYLNRTNDLYYGYQAEGCHFLLGAKYQF